MKRINFLTLTAAAVLSLSAVSCNTSAGVSSSVPEDRSQEWKALEQPLNFYIANDLGRNGYYDQKPIAETMGRMAEAIDIEFVVAAGDVHHFEGVQSVSDPLWMTNYELIYSHPDLMTLRDYDRENHTQLLKTLYCYLACGLNATAAAEALYIHRNTLYQRLGKIETLITSNLNNPETRLYLQISYQIGDFS